MSQTKAETVISITASPRSRFHQIKKSQRARDHDSIISKSHSEPAITISITEVSSGWRFQQTHFKTILRTVRSSIGAGATE